MVPVFVWFHWWQAAAVFGADVREIIPRFRFSLTFTPDVPGVVEIAPDGQPWAAYVDACEAVCEKTKKESIAANNGLVGTLVGGPNLLRK